MGKEVKILGAVLIAVVAAALIGASYYRNSSGITVPNASTSSNGSTTSPTTAATNNELLVRPDSPTLGAKDAKVTIVEFLDPECESCAAFHPIMKKALKDYEGQAKLVIRYMPLHPNSLSAATFLEAAGEQGKYWEAQDYLFQKQPEWGTKHGPTHGAPQPNVNVLFKQYAADLKLDIEKMNAAYAQNKFAEKLNRDKKDGETLGVSKTPTIFVNGMKLPRLDDTSLRFLINEALK